MKYTRRNMLQSLSAIAGATALPFAANGNHTDNAGFNYTPEDLNDIVNLFDFEKSAKGKMSDMAYEFVAIGAADEFTVRWNREALDKVKIQTTVLNDAGTLDTRATLLVRRCPT